ncbi:DEAD-domain-containing protein [Obba rivulosa]|uniref:RNA helicase n=1 Tax=Obba rivulosa TaxID=1052685 RepID=A0A8E2DKL1_9APHY|nr:DEAD-domain-containing protein [Obba rivulosa]
MALDLAVAQPTNEETSVKAKKSKKSKEEKEARKAEKRKRQQDEQEDIGGAEAADAPEQKKKKEKKEKAAKNEANEGASTSMAVDETPRESKLDKKKRKREQEQDQGEVPTAQSSSDKKEKKKRRKEVSFEEPIPSVEGPAVSSSSKKDKKKRKEKNSTLPVPSEPSVASSQPTTSKLSTLASTPSSSAIDAFLTKHSITITAPESMGKVVPLLSFDQLVVPAELRSAFSGFKEPTPIQACAWPPALEGRDVIGIAETGSGKTLAFGLPALANLIASPIADSKKAKGTTVSVLVMAPTRELAIQTHDTLYALGEPFGIASVAVFGGVDKGPQIKALQNANKGGKTTRIIVGTPGRILDLINDGVCDLSRVDYLVLDEADRMLDKGFENDIRSIIGHTKKSAERQTLMFSATWPDGVRRLAASFLRDPVRVTVGSDDLTANSRVEQIVEVFDDGRSKDGRLLGHLRNLLPKNSVKGSEATRVLVFALYKKEAARVEGMLRSKGYTVAGLHGDLSQNARMEALNNFKTGATTVLVATDVAARGLDIPLVAAVINYTFPLTIEDYIHRIGRTGRGGRSGKSITFFTGDSHERALAGELARVLRESGFECEGLKKFPMTIKKKEHSVYGAFFRDDIPASKGPTKITFG